MSFRPHVLHVCMSTYFATYATKEVSHSSTSSKALIQVYLEHCHRKSHHSHPQEDIKLMLIAEMLWLPLPYFQRIICFQFWRVHFSSPSIIHFSIATILKRWSNHHQEMPLLLFSLKNFHFQSKTLLFGFWQPDTLLLSLWVICNRFIQALPGRLVWFVANLCCVLTP